MLPISDETIATFCCWSCQTRPIILHASIPFSGFVPEQSVRITIKTDNRCGFDVSKTYISLKKVFTVISTTPAKRIWSDKQTLSKTIMEGARNGRETKIFGIIVIPPFTLPTNDEISNIVKVSYYVQVSLDVIGFARSPRVKLPIMIGTKPLIFKNSNKF